MYRLLIKRAADRNAVQRAIAEGGHFYVIHLSTHIKTDFYVPRDQESEAGRLARPLATESL